MGLYDFGQKAGQLARLQLMVVFERTKKVGLWGPMGICMKQIVVLCQGIKKLHESSFETDAVIHCAWEPGGGTAEHRHPWRPSKELVNPAGRDPRARGLVRTIEL